MVAKPQARSAEDIALDEIEGEDESAMKALVQQAGPPPDAEKLSEADLDEAWEFADPNVDYDQMASMLLSQGLPPEMAQSMLAFKLHPDWLADYQQPTGDAERAHQLARLAQYPFRMSILEDIDDPDEQVKEAERLDRRFQKRMTQMQLQQAAMPTGPYQGG